jgi:hypothetical protein
MQIEASGAYRKFRNHIKPEKAMSVTGSVVTILTVPAEWLGAIMGEAHWLVTEGKYFDTIRIDNGEKVYVKYDEEPIDFNTRRQKRHIMNGGKIMPEVHDITNYTEEQTTIQGIPVIDTALTQQMREAVKIHEAIIHHAGEAVTHLYEMGRQLKAMRDGKYYSHLGYESFGQYVEENGDYSFKERQAYKYIKIVETYSDSFIAENQGLGIERLEMLTALGERDAAELVESTDLAGMTTAEVKQLIKEKQGLGEQLSLLTEELEAAGSEKEKIAAEKQQALEEAEKKIKDLEKRLKAEKKKGKESIGEKDGEIMLLKEQLSSATPSAEQIEKIKNEADAEHQKEISAIKAEYEAKLSAAEDKMSAVEKKTRSADEAERRAALKVYFEETQKNINAFVEKVSQLEGEEREKFSKGVIKWLTAVIENLGKE